MKRRNSNMEKVLQSQCEELLKWKRIKYLHLNTFARCHKCGSFHPIDSNAGWPDFVIFTKRACTFIELKTIRGRLTKDQIEFKDWAEAIKYRYEIIRSFEEFEILLNYV